MKKINCLKLIILFFQNIENNKEKNFYLYKQILFRLSNIELDKRTYLFNFVFYLHYNNFFMGFLIII